MIHFFLPQFFDLLGAPNKFMHFQYHNSLGQMSRNQDILSSRNTKIGHFKLNIAGNMQWAVHQLNLFAKIAKKSD